MNLTEKGRELLAEIESIFSVTELPESPITIGSKNYAVLVKRASTKIRLGIEQRDAAMIVGAKGATTLISDEKGLRMPSMENAIEASLEKLILEELKPVSGDVVIIGSSNDRFLAELGAKSAALELASEV
jgi:DNA-binding XRE family transcriptional regulator